MIQKQKTIFHNLVESVNNQENLHIERNIEEYNRLTFKEYKSEHGGLYGVKPNKIENNILSFFTEVEPRKNNVFLNNTVLIDYRKNTSNTKFRPVTAKVVDIGSNYIDARILEDNNKDSIQNLKYTFNSRNSTVKIVPLLNHTPFNRQKEAINIVKESDTKRKTVEGLHEPNVQNDSNLDLDFKNLNQKQKKAAINALNEDIAYLIHGPPGTGKTRTLIEIIRHIVRNNKRVLVCAHSNQAVDNIVMGSSSLQNTDSNSLHYDGIFNNMKISRVGDGSKNNLVKANYGNVNPANSDVVATTINCASKFDINSFDVAIVDEASQATMESTFIPFSVSKKIILAGDHKQLPPYNISKSENKISLFEHFVELYGDNIKTTLQKQYRMNQKIARFSSKTFYDDMLTSAEENREWTVNNLNPIIGIESTDKEEKTTGNSYINKEESTIITNEINSLIEKGVKPENIGVITPYSGQVNFIKDKIKENNKKTSNIKVDTIDSFQGSERDVILVSFVRSNNTGEIGFLNSKEGDRRLNVALTRAKKRLVLVGNWSTLKSSNTYSSLYYELKKLGVIENK